MKKILVILTLGALMISGVIFNTGNNSASAAESVAAGSVIKGAGLSTLYYLAEDGKRYVFPNDKVYFSWYEDFSQVKEIPVEELYNYPLGGNVTYKPGILLVKIQTDPKVYAVGENGKLHWVKSEKIAKALYGDNWNKLVDDVPDSFFTNYSIGTDVSEEDGYSPSEEEEQVPTISHNRGLKAKVAAKIRTQKDKMCGHLEGALNKLQKRLDRWNIELPNLGDDVMDQCYGIKNDDSENEDAPRIGKKVTLCHKGETLSVGAPAARAHLKHGDTLGVCAEDDNTDEDDNEEDITAPAISAITATATGTTATITWTTNEAATGKVTYATSTLATASSTNSVTNNNLVANHSLTLTQLATSTIYHYMIESKDAAGNKATSSEFLFTSAQ